MSHELVIVGNKLDLWQLDCINSAEVQNYAFANGLIFMETSAKPGVNVREIFLAIGVIKINIKQIIFYFRIAAEELEKQKSRQAEYRTSHVFVLFYNMI